MRIGDGRGIGLNENDIAGQYLAMLATTENMTAAADMRMDLTLNLGLGVGDTQSGQRRIEGDPQFGEECPRLCRAESHALDASPSQKLGSRNGQKQHAHHRDGRADPGEFEKTQRLARCVRLKT